jgi:hypothetical protein
MTFFLFLFALTRRLGRGDVAFITNGRGKTQRANLSSDEGGSYVSVRHFHCAVSDDASGAVVRPDAKT